MNSRSMLDFLRAGVDATAPAAERGIPCPIDPHQRIGLKRPVTLQRLGEGLLAQSEFAPARVVARPLAQGWPPAINSARVRVSCMRVHASCSRAVVSTTFPCTLPRFTKSSASAKRSSGKLRMMRGRIAPLAYRPNSSACTRRTHAGVRSR